MTVRIQRSGSAATLYAEGRVDTNSAPSFAARMEEALPGTTDLTLDFSDLSYISSSGLRAVMLAVRTMSRQGSIRIVNVQPGVYEILETTGFTGLCDVEQLP